MTSSNINDVFGPEMFVNHIFKYLSYNDLRNASQTCRKWRKFFLAAYKTDQQIKCKFLETVHLYFINIDSILHNLSLDRFAIHNSIFISGGAGARDSLDGSRYVDVLGQLNTHVKFLLYLQIFVCIACF